MKTQYLFRISLLCFLGMLYACVHDPTSEASSNTQSDLLTVSAARELVERQMSLKTRSHTTPAKGLVPGDFSPLWSDAKTSQNAKVGSVDVPILPQYTYYALRTEEKNGKIKVHKVRISQKVVVIKAKDNGRLASYLLTLIPDGDYYSKNKNKFDEFLNSGSHKFSGVAVYYDLHARYTVRVDKYENGHKTAGVYLMCDSKDWNKRFKIAKKILGPIRIAKSANKMTRSFDEDDEMEGCSICGDPWCWGDCEDEDDWLYCSNCGSSWCLGNCDDDTMYCWRCGDPWCSGCDIDNPVIIEPDRCDGCGEYEFNCTCNVCSWCGNDPCTCNDACYMCGNDPCTCNDACYMCGNDPCTCRTCPYCGDDPCTCEEWVCPNCGDPSCSGNCTSGGEPKPDTGKDDDTPKSNPNDSKNKILETITNSEIRSFISKGNLPITPDDKIKTMTIRVESNSDGTVTGLKGILYNEQYFSNLTDQGQQLVLFHEYVHGYLAINGKSYDHSTLIESNDYLQGIKDIFPGQNDDFYKMMKYAGCADAPQFKNLSPQEKRDIATLVNSNIKKQ